MRLKPSWRQACRVGRAADHGSFDREGARRVPAGRFRWRWFPRGRIASRRGHRLTAVRCGGNRCPWRLRSAHSRRARKCDAQGKIASQNYQRTGAKWMVWTRSEREVVQASGQGQEAQDAWIIEAQQTANADLERRTFAHLTPRRGSGEHHSERTGWALDQAPDTQPMPDPASEDIEVDYPRRRRGQRRNERSH